MYMYVTKLIDKLLHLQMYKINIQVSVPELQCVPVNSEERDRTIVFSG